jgi:hypothetical protein
MSSIESTANVAESEFVPGRTYLRWALGFHLTVFALHAALLTALVVLTAINIQETFLYEQGTLIGEYVTPASGLAYAGVVHLAVMVMTIAISFHIPRKPAPEDSGIFNMNQGWRAWLMMGILVVLEFWLMLTVTATGAPVVAKLFIIVLVAAPVSFRMSKAWNAWVAYRDAK